MDHAWAYESRDGQHFVATPFTRGPWHPEHQHAGPPTALICRAIERLAAGEGLAHLGRLTVNLLRPVPIGELRVEVTPEYIGRNAGHYSARLIAGGKEVARCTALMQREAEVPVPAGTRGHPLPGPPRLPAECPQVYMPFARGGRNGARGGAGDGQGGGGHGGQRDGKADGRNVGGHGYGDFVENRLAEGEFFAGPCTAWFRMRHPLVAGEEPSAYQRVAVAADSGNGISAVLDFSSHVFVNCDLTIHLLRRPVGEWIALKARSALGGNGCGLAEAELFDERGLIGRAAQSLAVRERDPVSP
jgi:hypothetical protein